VMLAVGGGEHVKMVAVKVTIAGAVPTVITIGLRITSAAGARIDPLFPARTIAFTTAALRGADGRTVRSDGQMIRVSKQAQGSRRQYEHFFEEFEQGIESHRRRRVWILLKALGQPGDLPRTCCRSLT